MRIVIIQSYFFFSTKNAIETWKNNTKARLTNSFIRFGWFMLDQILIKYLKVEVHVNDVYTVKYNLWSRPAGWSWQRPGNLWCKNKPSSAKQMKELLHTDTSNTHWQVPVHPTSLSTNRHTHKWRESQTQTLTITCFWDSLSEWHVISVSMTMGVLLCP